MVQSKQVGAAASRSIVNYRLTCGFSASVFEPIVSKKDKAGSAERSSARIRRTRRSRCGFLDTVFMEKCAAFDSPRLFCWPGALLFSARIGQIHAIVQGVFGSHPAGGGRRPGCHRAEPIGCAGRRRAEEQSSLSHSGAMRCIEPGVARFRVRCWRTIPEWRRLDCFARDEEITLFFADSSPLRPPFPRYPSPHARSRRSSAR